MVEVIAPFAVVALVLGLAAFVFVKFAAPPPGRRLATAEARLFEVRLTIAEAYIQRLRMVVPEEAFTENELIGIFLIYTGGAGEEIVRGLEEIFSPDFVPEMPERHRISGAQSLLTWMKAHYKGDFSQRPLPIDGTNPWEQEAIESVKSFVEMVRTNRFWP